MSPGAWVELVASGLITGGVYALVALGLNLQYGLMRILNIAHGEFLMLGRLRHLARRTRASAGRRWRSRRWCSSLLIGVGLVVHRLAFRPLAATSRRTSTCSRRAA